MNKEIQEKAMQALKRQEKQYQRQNEYIKNNYDRQTVTMPKGTAALIRENVGQSVNAYINGLVIDDLTRRGLLPGQDAGQQQTTEPGQDQEPPRPVCPY